MPQLNIFQDFYDSPKNKIETEIKCIVKWLGGELIKSPPINASDNNKAEQKTKVVPRDVKKVTNSALLQDGLAHKLLILLHMLGCMVCFVQIWDDRIDTGIFEACWLVNNNTEPTVA